jgi:hypothetical protein
MLKTLAGKHRSSVSKIAARPKCGGDWLVVVADHEIGHCAHPVTGQQLTYIACTSTAGLDARAVALDELVEVRWLDHSQVEEFIPGLIDPVREHIDSQRPCPCARRPPNQR